MINYPNLYVATPADITTILIATALVLISFFCVIIAGMTALKNTLLRAIAALAIDLVIFHAVFDAATAAVMGRPPVSFLGRHIGDINFATEASLTLFLMGMAIYRLVSLLRLRSNTVTVFSVGDALDDLPRGILFAGKNGQIFQANKTMEELNLKLTKEPLMDAEAFWEKVKNGYLNEDVLHKPGENPVIRLSDGTTWIFRRQLRHSEVADFYQIVAANATEEQNITEEADHSVSRLTRMNRRLQDYNHIVDETIRKEELLETKKRVHDNMGTSLLKARMLILNEESPVTPTQVLEDWQEDLTLLLEEAKEKDAPVDPLARFHDAANFLGIELQIMGHLPEPYAVADLITTGIQECMTNAIQHAEATQMYVTITEEEDEYTATYSNNGKPAPKLIREGGGLGMLRAEAKKAGATMEYLPGKHFSLILHIPKLQ